MQTVVFFLIMSVAWCVFYLYEAFTGKHPAQVHVYFILMHAYFIGFILSRRMYLLKNEEKIKNILKTRRLKKQIKKMRKGGVKHGDGNADR